MKKVVETGLPTVPGRPLEWAVIADGVLYTTQLPIKADGSFETGNIAAQTDLTLMNLKQTIEAAGWTMGDVTQVIIYLPDPQDFAGMNDVYARYFSPPYPNRATLVSKLVVPDVRVEMIAYAHIDGTQRRQHIP